jgi:hypothetical protein
MVCSARTLICHPNGTDITPHVKWIRASYYKRYCESCEDTGGHFSSHCWQQFGTIFNSVSEVEWLQSFKWKSMRLLLAGRGINVQIDINIAYMQYKNYDIWIMGIWWIVFWGFVGKFKLSRSWCVVVRMVQILWAKHMRVNLRRKVGGDKWGFKKIPKRKTLRFTINGFKEVNGKPVDVNKVSEGNCKA